MCTLDVNGYVENFYYYSALEFFCKLTWYLIKVLIKIKISIHQIDFERIVSLILNKQTTLKFACTLNITEFWSFIKYGINLNLISQRLSAGKFYLRQQIIFPACCIPLLVM